MTAKGVSRARFACAVRKLGPLWKTSPLGPVDAVPFHGHSHRGQPLNIHTYIPSFWTPILIQSRKEIEEGERKRRMFVCLFWLDHFLHSRWEISLILPLSLSSTRIWSDFSLCDLITGDDISLFIKKLAQVAKIMINRRGEKSGLKILQLQLRIDPNKIMSY